MAVHINEVETEVHAFDASALLTDEVLAVLIPLLAARVEAQGKARTSHNADAQIMHQRRRTE